MPKKLKQTNPSKKTPQNPQTKQQKTPKDTNMDNELPKAVNFMEELTNLSDNKQDWILPYQLEICDGQHKILLQFKHTPDQGKP